MKKIVPILLGVLSFYLLFLFTSYLFQTRGITVNDWTIINNSGDTDKSISIPFSENIITPDIYHFQGKFAYHTKDTFVLTRANGYAFKVLINKQLVGSVGNFEYPTSNIWNYTHCFDLSNIELQEENIIDIYVYGLHDIGFLYPPYFADIYVVSPYINLQNFVTNGFSYIMIGAMSVFSFLLIFFAIKSSNNKMLYLFHAIGYTFYTIYNYEYILRFDYMSIETFLWVRKFIMICIYFACYFLLLGNLTFMKKRKVPAFINISYVVIISGFILSGTPHSLRVFLNKSNVFLIFVILYIIYITFRYSKTNMLLVSSFMFTSIIHTLSVDIFQINSIYLLNFGVFAFFLGSCFSIVLEFGKLESQVRVLDTKAKRDPLTGLYNRSVLESYTFTSDDIIMFIDINDFKPINDIYGHDKGDEILKLVADTLKEYSREEDFTIRYGGDEFIVIFRNITVQNASLRAERIVDSLKRHKENIIISYGLNPAGYNMENAIFEADKKMYQMKSALKAMSIQHKENLT